MNTNNGRVHYSIRFIGTIWLIVLMMMVTLQQWTAFAFSVMTMLFIIITIYYCSMRFSIISRRNQIRRVFLEQVMISSPPEDNPPSYEEILQTEAPPPEYNSLSLSTNSTVYILRPNVIRVYSNPITPALLRQTVQPPPYLAEHTPPENSQHGGATLDRSYLNQTVQPPPYLDEYILHASKQQGVILDPNYLNSLVQRSDEHGQTLSISGNGSLG